MQNVVFNVQHADTGRSVELMPGENVEIAIQRLNINGVVHHRLRPVHQHFCANLMGFGDDLCHRVFGSQHVGDLGESHQAGTFIQQGIQPVKL
ncbi:Uncharacterised protein [Leclercia adecarboxylata]|uniref:Uncharacterized protein n=1 Tax=Leclercia adecarboxylata TaxID=83655 RepID=A0A4U9HRW5_9ENTR|nr:Uncharacterised protein [Leclercia adecarboxylata]